MKSLYYSLILIGVLGVASGVYALIANQDWTNGILGCVCGGSLLVGARELKKNKDSGG